jgi:hypothetical protein
MFYEVSYLDIPCRHDYEYIIISYVLIVKTTDVGITIKKKLTIISYIWFEHVHRLRYFSQIYIYIYIIYRQHF